MTTIHGMTEQRHPNPDEQDATADDASTLDVDIGAALESVAALSDILAEREAEEQRQAETEATAREAAAAAEAARAEADPVFEAAEPARMATPPVSELRRGQPASVVPALLLIGLGSWLTFALSTASSGAVALPPLLVIGVVGGAVVLTLLTQWLGGGRWARGSFFLALFGALTGGALYYDIISGANLMLGAPLTLAAAGVALVLTGLLGRPADRRLFLPGLLLIFGGIVALALLQGAISPLLAAELAHWSPLVLAVLIVIWLLPVLLKRRG